MEIQYDIIFDTTFMVGVGLCKISSMFQNKKVFGLFQMFTRSIKISDGCIRDLEFNPYVH